MADVSVRFLGAGDAFGDGGRFQACLELSGGGGDVLIDCGASSLVAMQAAGVDPSAVGHVLLTHLHGDHFGGLPFMILDGQFRRRERPLVIAGPAGTRERLGRTMEALFPGSWVRRCSPASPTSRRRSPRTASRSASRGSVQPVRAMIMRWISLLPPAMRMTRASRYSRSTVVPRM